MPTIIPHPLPRLHRFLAGLAALLLSATLASASLIQWSDTFLGYRYGWDYREPSNPESISKNIFQLQHTNGYTYGTNFLNLDCLISDSNDPRANSTAGATEYYLIYRNTLSVEKISGRSMHHGILRDFGLTLGFDLSTKNDAFAASVRKLAVGPTIDFAVPGFLSIGFLLTKENNHNGIVGKNVYFDPTYCLAVAWGIPFKGTPFVFKGFANFTGVKGKDGFGAETAPETLIEAALMVDPFYKNEQRKNKLFVGIGYQYWNNKFGNDASADPSGGSRASLPQLQLEYHF